MVLLCLLISVLLNAVFNTLIFSYYKIIVLFAWVFVMSDSMFIVKR